MQVILTFGEISAVTLLLNNEKNVDELQKKFGLVEHTMQLGKKCLCPDCGYHSIFVFCFDWWCNLRCH